MDTVLTIGDCIVDAIEEPGRPPRTYPGGAGLNLAVGLAHLGPPSTLLTRIGADRAGFRLARYLRERRVRLLNTPNVDFTGRALSTRIDGEPAYFFSSDMRRRRYAFGPAAEKALAQAAAIAVNSFPFEDWAQAAALAARLRDVSGLVMIDPNPRSDLIDDMALFRQGVMLVLASASVVKLSEEDAALLFGTAGEQAVAALFGAGVGTILLTRGGKGAALFRRDGLAFEVDAAPGYGPVIDTMGAGDAVLACVIAHSLARGLPASAEAWEACLIEAMNVAGATCRSEGGELVKPGGARQAPLESRGGSF